MSGDAGNRRYFRVGCGGQTFIAVHDSSPTQIRKFLRARALLSSAGARVPALVAANKTSRFLLLEDFGDTTLLRHITRCPQEQTRLYQTALDALIRIQLAPVGSLPLYAESLLRREMNLYQNWHLPRHHQRAGGRRALAGAADYLQAQMASHAQVVVHRDYHSRNLMLPDVARQSGGAESSGILKDAVGGGRSSGSASVADASGAVDDAVGGGGGRLASLSGGADALGVLDFQDAVIGSAAYDCVSLLKDAYIYHPVAAQMKLLKYYHRRALAAGVALPMAFDEFALWYHIAGAQRGLKVVGIFARLAARDNKPQYLDDIPTARRHLQDSLKALKGVKSLQHIPG